MGAGSLRKRGLAESAKIQALFGAQPTRRSGGVGSALSPTPWACGTNRPEQVIDQSSGSIPLVSRGVVRASAWRGVVARGRSPGRSDGQRLVISWLFGWHVEVALVQAGIGGIRQVLG